MSLEESSGVPRKKVRTSRWEKSDDMDVVPPPLPDSGAILPPPPVPMHLPAPPPMSSSMSSTAAPTTSNPSALQDILAKLNAKDKLLSNNTNIANISSTYKHDNTKITSSEMDFLPVIPLGTIKDDERSRIFVGNIPQTMKQKEIEVIFSVYGHIHNIDWYYRVTDSTSLSSEDTPNKGYCFVWYSDISSSYAAIEGMKNSSFEYDGKVFTVSRPSKTSNIDANTSSSSSAAATSIIAPQGKVWSAADALAAAMGTATTPNESNTAKGTNTNIEQPIQQPLNQKQDINTPLYSFIQLNSQNNYYILGKNIPNFFDEDDITCLLNEAFNSSDSSDATKSISIVVNIQRIASQPRINLNTGQYTNNDSWTAQIEIKNKFITHNILYTINKNIILLNNYINDIIKLITSKGYENLDSSSSNNNDDDYDDKNFKDINRIGSAISDSSMTATVSMSFEHLPAPIVRSTSHVEHKDDNSMVITTHNNKNNEIINATLKLQYMVSMSEINDPDLESDIAEEASEFGKLLKSTIIIPNTTETDAALTEPELPIVCLQYSQSAEARTAQCAMNGKFFGDTTKQVIADIISNTLYPKHRK